MKLSTEKKIEFVVEAQMPRLRKLKKVDLQDICRDILADYIRELSDETIADMYNEAFFGSK